MPNPEKTKFGRKATEDGKSIRYSNKETYLRIILIDTIHISLNCLTTSLTLLAFFKSNEMEKNLVKHKQPIVDEGRIYKRIIVEPSKGSKPQKVILEKPTMRMTKTRVMSNL